MRSIRMVAVIGATILVGLLALPSNVAAQSRTVVVAPAPNGHVRVYRQGHAWYPRHYARAYGYRYARPRYTGWYGPRMRHGYRHGYRPHAYHGHGRHYYRPYGMPRHYRGYRGYRGVI